MKKIARFLFSRYSICAFTILFEILILALVIFAKWNPAKAIFGSFLFGALTVLQSWKGNLKEAFPSVLGWVDVIPNEFYQMLPFVITFIVLVVSSIRDKGRGEQPTCCGINYYREER